MDSPFKIDVISTNFPRRILTLNRWRIDEDVSIVSTLYVVIGPANIRLEEDVLKTSERRLSSSSSEDVSKTSSRRLD